MLVYFVGPNTRPNRVHNVLIEVKLCQRISVQVNFFEIGQFSSLETLCSLHKKLKSQLRCTQTLGKGDCGGFFAEGTRWLTLNPPVVEGELPMIAEY